MSLRKLFFCLTAALLIGNDSTASARAGVINNGDPGSGVQATITNVAHNGITPEPATMLLLGARLVGVAAMARRRRRAGSN